MFSLRLRGVPAKRIAKRIRWFSDLVYSDKFVSDLLGNCKTIAMVGASGNWKRPSYFVFKYLQQKGYRVVPVNPAMAAKGEAILGEKCYASLSDVPGPIDMVDVFRGCEAAVGVCNEAVSLRDSKGIKAVWLQLTVKSEQAKKICEDNGIDIVMDRCPKIEFTRLFGEFHGLNSKRISSKRTPRGQYTATDSPGFEGLETKCIHAGAKVCADFGARQTPIYQTSSFVFDSCDAAASQFNLQTPGHIYSRLSNPTTAVLEERIASLEDGVGATCASSGHAAQMLLLSTLLRPGDRFVAAKNLYGGSINQFSRAAANFGWHVDFCDIHDKAKVADKLSDPKCKFLFAESIANPGGMVSDIELLASMTSDAKVPLCIDNTLATPILCQPKIWGANIILHSCTKFLTGNGTSLGGAIVDCGTFDFGSVPAEKYPTLTLPEPAYHGLTFWESFGDLALTSHMHAVGLRDLGSCIAPMNSFQTLLGIETLHLRMERHTQNAVKVAAFLASHPKVKDVSFNDPLAEKYIVGGIPGSVFTFRLNGGFEAGVKLVESCHLFSHLANIGDTRSLILHPGSTTHRQLSDKARLEAGAGDDVIRLSIGLESITDILKDLEHALGKI